jgi:hypothetical protein
MDVYKVDSVKLEVSSKQKTKLDFKVSDEGASGRASRMIYTPCLGPKNSTHAKKSIDVAGNAMLGKLVAFPWGLCPELRGPNILPLDWFSDKPRRVD